jgi:hypothetical protein
MRKNHTIIYPSFLPTHGQRIQTIKNGVKTHRARKQEFILDVLEETCAIMVQVMVEHQSLANKQNPDAFFHEKGLKRLELYKHEVWNYNAVIVDANNFIYCVTKEIKWMVDLGKQTCSCGDYQDTGFPCIHAAAAVAKLKLYPHEQKISFYERFFDPIYRRSSLVLGTKNSLVPPLRSELTPQEHIITPSETVTREKKGRGRPTGNGRYLSKGEFKRVKN